MYTFLKYYTIGSMSCYALDHLSLLLYSRFGRNPTYSQNVRWFFIHFIINLLITFYGFTDLLFCLTNIDKCALTPWFHGEEAYGLVISLHIYHILAFKLTKIDWLHHIVTIVMSAPLVLVYTPVCNATLALWFLSGFPGAIDYFLLWGVKMGFITSQFEKRAYVVISAWLRQPGCVLSSVLSLKAIDVWDTLTTIETIVIIWNVLVIYWNGCFFMQITLADYYTKYNRIKYERLKEYTQYETP